MSNRKRPQKPERNPGHIVFPKKGPVRFVVEEFPRVQEELEITVGKKFLGALQHFEKIQYYDLSKGAEPADLVCVSNEGAEINLQVVEVVDLQLRQLQRMRSSYRATLTSRLGEEILRFNGCKVSLVDTGDPPYLPLPDTKKGQVCLEQILDHLRNLAKDIHSLEVGKIRCRKVTTVDPVRQISTLVERRMAPQDPPRLEFHWEGGGPSYRADVPRGLLIDAVQSKLDKQYVSPSGNKFILLAYSIDALIMKDDLDVLEVQSILDTQKHPFDEVWFIYPYAEKGLGSIFCIWPSGESAT